MKKTILQFIEYVKGTNDGYIEYTDPDTQTHFIFDRDNEPRRLTISIPNLDVETVDIPKLINEILPLLMNDQVHEDFQFDDYDFIDYDVKTRTLCDWNTEKDEWETSLTIEMSYDLLR